MNYYHTKKGLISRMYGSQVQRSKKRGHPAPTYTKEELKEWLYSQPRFHKFFDNWKILGFQKEYVPSIDRKDDYVGYTISNIRLTIWKRNNRRYKRDKIKGINNKDSKAVMQFTKKGKYIATYHSMSEASRQTNIDVSGISLVCKGQNKLAGGYRWQKK